MKEAVPALSDIKQEASDVYLELPKNELTYYISLLMVVILGTTYSKYNDYMEVT